MYKMFTAMYGGLELKPKTNDTNYRAKVSLKTVDITRQNIEMFILQFCPDNESEGIYIDQTKSTLENSFNLLSVLDKHLDQLIILNTEDKFRILSEHYFSYKTMNVKPIQSIAVDKQMWEKHFSEIYSLNCLFTWDLPHGTLKRDIITHIKNKYGDYNIDISQPVFIFER